MTAELPPWPPAADPEALDALCTSAVDYALGHGLVLRPPAHQQGPNRTPSTSAVIHAPISLYPSPFPQHCFELALRLQPIYNALYAHVAASPAFLDRVIGGSVSRVDDFTGHLYEIYRSVEREGRAQAHHLGLFRSDYLLHRERDGGWGIRQVEFNTISSSFGPLSHKVSDMHRYLAQIGGFPPLISLDTLPDNKATSALASGLAAGHSAWQESASLQQTRTTRPPTSDAQLKDPVVLFVVQPNERNAFDQRLLEYELLAQHRVRSIRLTFSEIAQYATLSSDGDRHLVLGLPSSLSGIPLTVSVVYFRAGYTPNDYPSESEWSTRLLLERSSAINCPSVALQLAGAKKVQQVLAEPGELDRFVGSSLLSSSDMELLRASWTEMYPLDGSERGKEGYRLASDPETAKHFVLKPQREGGGNNIYGLKIPSAIEGMERRDEGKRHKGGPKEREGYILMSMIRPPKDRKAVLVRANPEKNGSERVNGEVISELGMYGIALSSKREDGVGAEVKLNVGDAGHLLRTKASGAEEGGVAVGISCLDSPLLV